jgi:hypothetical protein
MIDAKHKDFIKTMEQHEEKLSNILAKPSDGIWLSQGMTWLCLTLLILLSLFFCLTIYATPPSSIRQSFPNFYGRSVSQSLQYSAQLSTSASNSLNNNPRSSQPTSGD